MIRHHRAPEPPPIFQPSTTAGTSSELPSGVDIVEFVQHDGRQTSSTGLAARPVNAKLSLAALRDRYLETRGEVLEPRTLETARLHFKHLCAILGDGFPIRELTLADLQGYVNRRGKQKNAQGIANLSNHGQEGYCHPQDRLELGREDATRAWPIPP